VVASLAVREDAAPASQGRLVAAWLFSRRADLLILGVPALGTLTAAIVGLSRGGDALGERAYAAWVAQFILGNTTHVILTYLLLGTRRDILHATPGQARTVVIGSIATFAVTFGMLWITGRTFPAWSEFGVAIVAIFATHHTVSQAKGLWSLHNLRGKTAGLPPPAPRERSAQQTFVPLALLLVMIRILFVPKSRGAMFPFIQAVPGLEAVLPFAVTWGLLAVWLGFAAYALSTIARGPRISGPKLLYVGAHMAGVALTIVAPPWGVIFTSGVHGLEYYTITARMLRPTAAELRRDGGDPHAPRTRLSRALVAPAMIGIMLPIFIVGLGAAPFAAAIGLVGYASLFGALRIAVNGVVVAHYFADAFIYRFRIPEVRRVALERLGFA
jgi:hypothetical protein